MKKIVAILALMMMALFLASCGGNKEGSKAEEGWESAKVETVEKATPKASNKEVKVPQKAVKNDNISNNLSWSTSWTGKTEDQVVKDFEKELDWLFKLLESNANTK